MKKERHEKISISLPAEVVKKLKAKAKKLGISVSALITLVLSGEAEL